MREDALLRIKLINQQGSEDGLRNELQRGIPSSGDAIPTSTDLPLSQQAKRVLSCAAEEAEKLKHPSIDSGHLVLGVFAMKGLAAAALDRHGVTCDSYREALVAAHEPSRPVKAAGAPAANPQALPDQPPMRETAAPSLRGRVSKLSQIVEQTFLMVAVSTENFGYQRLKQKPWTRKEALGHLIDWAAIHQGWFARAMSEPSLAVNGYPDESWVTAQRYNEISWRSLLELWASLNRLLVHVLANIPEEKLNLSCRIGMEPPRTLVELIGGYIDHCEDITGQMLGQG